MAAARALDVLVGAGDQRRRAWAPALAVGTHILGVTAMSRGEVHGSTPLPARGALAATSAITAATLGGPVRRAAGSPTGAWAPAGAAGWTPAGLAATAVLTGLFAQAVGPAQVAAAQEPSGPKLRRAVGAGIHGLVPLQAAWCARAGAPKLGAALAVALPLAKALARKVSPT
jgi:4-hydroxybenzoate polyprenyltransferase